MRSFWRRVSPAADRRSFIVVLLLGLILLPFIWRLGSLTPGLGVDEYHARQMPQSVSQIINHGINTPYYMVQFLAIKLPLDDALSLRLASVLFSLIILVGFFSLLRSWFGLTTTLVSSLIFASTPWVVLLGRTAGPDVMYLWPVILLACFTWLIKKRRPEGAVWIAVCVLVGIGLYTPGIVWLLLAAAIIGRPHIAALANRVGKSSLFAGLAAGFIVCLPLIYSLILHPWLIRNLFLVPADWPPLLETLKSIAWSGLGLFWHTRSHVDIIIDKLAILNIAQIALCGFGIYALAARIRGAAYALAGLLLFAIIAAGINQDMHLISLGLAAIGVFITAGLRYLYIEWRRIFPLNPISNALAATLILLVVSVHVLYGIRYSLIAWPQTEATRSSYVLK